MAEKSQSEMILLFLTFNKVTFMTKMFVYQYKLSNLCNVVKLEKNALF